MPFPRNATSPPATTATTATTEATSEPTLADQIIDFLRRYVVLPSEEHELILALWVIHTWMVDASDVTPYLYVYSKDPASGKTRLLDVISVMACNAQRGDDMTPNVAFKLIERAKGNITLLTDEVDTKWSGNRNEWWRRTFNTGYKRGGSAWREQARELVEFSTFCPKLLAGLDNGFMPRTIRDRCIPFPMTRKDKNQRVDRFIEREVQRSKQLEEVLEAIFDFRENCYPDVTVMRPKLIGALSDRQNEISEPLLAIAAVLGIEQKLRDALVSVFQDADGQTSESPQQAIFRRIKDAFGTEQKMWSRDLCAALGDHYTGRALALFLEPYGIYPKDIRVGNQVAKGYGRETFEQVFATYCDTPDIYVVDDEEDDFDRIENVVDAEEIQR